MTRPVKLDDAAVTAWLTSHGHWTRAGESLVRSYTFDNFSRALAFVVEVSLLAEKHDHHPDVELSWGKAKLTWSTHDAGGITALDQKLAEASDTAYGPRA